MQLQPRETEDAPVLAAAMLPDVNVFLTSDEGFRGIGAPGLEAAFPAAADGAR